VKCIFVTATLQEYVAVDRPESQQSQIMEIIELMQWLSGMEQKTANNAGSRTGLMQWHSVEPWSAAKLSATALQRWWQYEKHLRLQAAIFRAQQITLDQTGQFDILFLNALGTQGNHTFCSSLNHLISSFQFGFWFIYLHTKLSTHSLLH